MALKSLYMIPVLLGAAVFALPVTADVIEHEFDVDPGDRLRIRAEGASIDIDTGATSRAFIGISRQGDSRSRILREYDIEVSQNGDEIFVSIDRKRAFSGLFGLFRRDLEIEISLPRRFDVDLTTSGGSIVIDDLDGQVEATASGGSLRFAAVEGSVRARTSGGSISIARCNGDTDVRTSGGSIRLEEVRGAVNAVTSGGSVIATISEQPRADSRLTTSGGSVTIYLDDDVAVDLDARTSGGRVRTDFDVSAEHEGSRSRLQAAINGGGPELYLRTSGGSISVRRN